MKIQNQKVINHEQAKNLKFKELNNTDVLTVEAMKIIEGGNKTMNSILNNNTLTAMTGM